LQVVVKKVEKTDPVIEDLILVTEEVAVETEVVTEEAAATEEAEVREVETVVVVQEDNFFKI
jgi:hypothetical protein